MEGIERMNIIMVHPNQRAKFTQYNPYTIDMDRGNRNCYNYGGFEYIARNCRNRETELEKKEDWNIDREE